MKRQVLALCAAGLIAWLLALPAPPALAQQGSGSSGDITMTLVSQTPWNTPKRSDLDLKVQIDNSGTDPIDNAELNVEIFDALISRGSYDQSQTEDVGSPLPSTWSPVPLKDPIDPGATAVVHFHADVGFLGQNAAEGRVYPLVAQLVSTDPSLSGAPLAELRTPVIFIPKTPKVPLDFSWTFVLGQPYSVGPDGAFRNNELERRLEPGGAIDGEIAALANITSAPGASPLDLVVAPSLIDQLQQMQDGYTVDTGGAEPRHVAADEPGAMRAAAALASIKSAAAAPGVQLSAMPFSSPNIPQLLSSGLGQDLGPQLALGRQVVQDATQMAPDATILRPPASAIDDTTVTRLHGLGVATLLLDPGTVEQPRQPKDFAPPAAVTVDSGGGSAQHLTAIAPDEGTAAYVAASTTSGDPRLSAQRVLGDLAQLWLEQPDTSRSAALLVSTEQTLPAGFLSALSHTLPSAPWLEARTATGLADRNQPSMDPVKFHATHADPIPAAYLNGIENLRTQTGRYRSILVHPETSDLLSALSRGLLLTEGSALVADQQLGFDWLDSLTGRLKKEFEGLLPDTTLPVTLTSSTGVIPLRVPNRSGEDLRVQVELQSSHLQILGTNPRPVTPAETLNFSVRTKTTGTFPVRVLVETPQGDLIGESNLVVRSTAFSRIALYITIGAILVLIGLWARRFLRRARTTTS